MFDNLKQSEKILLSILGVAIVMLLIFNFILPKYKKLDDTKAQIKELNNTINGQGQLDKIENSLNPLHIEEKNLDNLLLTYKNDFYIDNFSQSYLILKLNDFVGENSSATDGFTIVQAVFKKIEYVEPEVTDDTTDNADENALPDEQIYNDENGNEIEEELPPEDIELETFSLTDIDPSTLNPNVADYFEVSLDFFGNYDSLVKYISNVENFSDSIVITSLTLSPVVENSTVSQVSTDNNEVSTSGFTYLGDDGYVRDVPDEYFSEKGIVKGNLQIIFINFKIYDNSDDFEYSNPIFDIQDELTVVDNPFRPYENFTHYELPQTEDSNDNNNSNGYDNNNVNTNNDFVEQPSLIYRTIYGFENNQFFFTPSPSSTKGSAILSPIPYSGNKSGKLTYNFVKGVENSTASFVFDSNSILISEKPNSVALKVYELTDMPYELGITVKDSSGKLYDVILPKNGTSNELWSTYEGPLPELTYPCIVKRVFVTTNGVEKTQLQGELLLDQLEVSKSVN